MPQSKNRTRGHFSAWVYILSCSAYQTAYIHQVSFFDHNLHQADSQFHFRGLGVSAPVLKKNKGGISQRGSTSYLFQRVKMPTFTKFHVSITIHTKCIHNNVVEAWGSVPKSRNRIRGHFAEWVYILSFSACQTAYIHQVSCWYHILHDSCVKLPHYA